MIHQDGRVCTLLIEAQLEVGGKTSVLVHVAAQGYNPKLCTELLAKFNNPRP